MDLLNNFLFCTIVKRKTVFLKGLMWIETLFIYIYKLIIAIDFVT